jgi:hypothetical protein
MTALVINSIIGSGIAGQTKPAPPHTTGLPQSLRLYVFDCGTTHITKTERFGFKREEVATADLSDPCFLVAHPKGTLIWDTGAVQDAAWNPVGHPVVQHVVLPDSQERDVTVVNSLRAQLAEVGYSPSDITYLALSHYHYDHTANANEFAASTWLVRQAERDAMFAEKPPGITQPSTYSALRQSKTVILKADEHDVFGDGTVIIKSAPRAHSGPSGPVFEACEDRGRHAVWRTLSLSRRARAGPRANLRVRPRADPRKQSGTRHIFEEDGRTALDTARLQRQCESEEVAQFYD